MAENQLPSNEKNNKSVRLYKKKRFLLPVTFLLVVAILVGVYWFMFLRDFVSTDDAYVDANQLDVSAKILGRITELTVDEGDTLKQGELLVQLSDSDLRAQENQEMQNIASSEQNVSLTQVALELAENDYRRTRSLYEDSIVTYDQFDHAEKAFRMAQAQHNVALAQVNTSKARLNVVMTSLQNTKITSPMNGVVAKKWVLPGDVVQPGQAILSLFDLENIWITANFEETKLSSIHPGDPVEISVDAYPNIKFRGKVLLIGTVTASQFSLIPPNNASGNYTKVTQRVPVKISIEKAPNQNQSAPIRLLPGMSVEVKIRVRGNK
jgi:membrane fusion protein (multidrug efflux system)